MSNDNLPVIQTAGLTKVFKDFWRRARVVAVKDLDLEIHRGEVFGLLGPNGSGKSTTIKMLLGLLYPTRGRISIFGRSPTDVAVKARIGFLPEDSYLYRFLNARETLDYYARLFRQSRGVRAERIDRLLEMVGLQHEAKRRVGEYSKGMARRIGLAQALINDPELLILDEPTAGLDPVGTRQIKDLIRDLGKRGKTILLSSHLLADVEDVCDRITILYGGQERAAGRTRDLLSQKDLTCITTERLSDETVEEVKALVRRRENKEVLEVSSPSDRLESYFLRVVSEAQAANVRTSGARAAGALPDFLGKSGPTGATVIDNLVGAARRQPATEEVLAPPAPETDQPAAQKLIEQLTTRKPVELDEPDVSASTTAGAEDAERTAEPSPPAKQVEADRSVIDGLLSKPKKHDDDGGGGD
ncbi:MAG: ABC transporter ATP-binding protein [Planctomycetes bacterium]|nr:ABC transporter ATP-binding protein [Planctomycetota bacterium]